MEYPEVKKVISELFERLGFANFSIEARIKSEGDPVTFSIQSEDANILIGEHGQNLRALEQISKILVSKSVPDSPNFVIDINNYKRERENYLKELARSVAQKVAIEKRPFRLPPMSAFERRIIHNELASRPDVVTESQGEEPERKIVVKPYL